ncbi:HdeD family acid-resistance protein [Protaetiibacter larvae]|uniref:HdeD family acid-resistance protein n=1 Tax=Protaetiibacter larvae TaxID=2592654 RepID=A0A5C1YB55_9MICO|nr:DUF308 domain-containing protein [Protaetiibacter larvae]QEO10495.1 HdeD family acid-resistance protein [Protaetiibacter larvae]
MSNDAVAVSSFIKSIWWLVLLRGVLLVVLGILAFIWPVATAGAVFWVFGIYAIADGITEIVHAFATRKTDRRWGWLLVIGILGVLAGIALLVFPFAIGALTLLILLWFVVFWAIVNGIMGIPAAAALAGGAAKTMAIVFSLLSIVFGVLLAILLWTTPGNALVWLIYVLGAYAVLAGIVLVVLAFQARSAANAVLATR